MTSRPVAESEALLAHWMGPADANGTGNIHGGTIMRLVDEVAGVAAVKFCRGRVVTVSMDRMDFLVPVHVMDVVTFKATVNASWHTSMEIGVRVESEHPATGEVRHSNTAYLTYVALDEAGRPCPVPEAIAETPEQQRRMREAQQRRASRLALREALLAHRRQSGDLD
ncbi:MAG TPA: acyl-CoA thioesterase [Solirubrobacteraceae bacterium]|nr:acyl-CoA thioesterase [Solirubrobacteraceae bacterium]